MTYKGAPMMSECQSWATPGVFIEWLEAWNQFAFDLDAAADPGNAKAPNYYTEQDNSLNQVWFGNVWLNPPFGRGGANIKSFLTKCIEQKNNCTSIWVLIPARTDTRSFHELVIPNAYTIYLIKGRFNFIHPTKSNGANATFPSMLIEFRPDNYWCGHPDWQQIQPLELDKQTRGFQASAN